MAKIPAVYIVCFIRLTLMATTQCCSECSLHWHSYSGNCYLLIEDPKSFWDAEDYCKSLSRQGREAHLVSIANQQEENFIQGYADPYGYSRVWIGSTLNHTSQELYWVDGSKAQYVKWRDGQPDEEGDNICIILRFRNSWADLSCDGTFPFICKIIGSLHWHSYNGNCYLMIEDPKSSFWEDFCKNLSRQGRAAHLVSIPNQQEEDFIKGYVKPFGYCDVWIGFTNQTTQKYYWVDGSQAQYSSYGE